MAAGHGHVNVVKILLNTTLWVNIQVNLTAFDGSTPLHIAAEFGFDKVVKELLKNSSIEVNLEDVFGATPMFLAANERHAKIVNLLLGTEKIKALGWHGWRPDATAG